MQPCELKHRVTYRAIQELNRCGIGYLIVTKSHLIASPEYLAILDKRLAHVQISVTCLDDEMALSYEKASVPSKRIAAISKLQAAGFDVSIRLSPLIEEFMDFDTLNSLNIEKCIIEFLRINSWIKNGCMVLTLANIRYIKAITIIYRWLPNAEFWRRYVFHKFLFAKTYLRTMSIGVLISIPIKMTAVIYGFRR